jgi:large subunit ribosomal protein L1
MEKEQIDKLSAFLGENKGKRKFTQSVDLVVNFRNIDFSKQDNRLNMEIKLPYGKGKVSKVMLFSDDAAMSAKASQLGIKVAKSGELASIATDKVKMAELLEYELIAQPALMPQIAKTLGQFLGPRNKMPRPVIGDVSAMIGSMGKSLFVRSKGKYLPTAHCVVGTEQMPQDQIAANIDEVIGAFAKKTGKQNIRSVFIKLTMSSPVRLI